MRLIAVFLLFLSCVTAQEEIGKSEMIKLLSYDNEVGTEQYSFS